MRKTAILRIWQVTHGKWPKQWPRQSYATVLSLGSPSYSSRLDKLTSGLGHVWIINSKWKSMMQLFIPNFCSSLALWLYLVFSRIDARLIWWQSDIDSGNGLWSLGSKPAQLHSPLPQCRRYWNTLRKYPRWLYWGILSGRCTRDFMTNFLGKNSFHSNFITVSGKCQLENYSADSEGHFNWSGLT